MQFYAAAATARANLGLSSNDCFDDCRNWSGGRAAMVVVVLLCAPQGGAWVVSSLQPKISNEREMGKNSKELFQNQVSLSTQNKDSPLHGDVEVTPSSLQ